MIPPRQAVKWIVRRPERNDVHADFLRHFDGALDGLRMVVPVEQEIFPFQHRRFQAARVAIRHHRLHRGVSLLKTALMHVFRAHLVADAMNGKQDVTQTQRRLALGLRVQQNAVRGNQNPAVGIFRAQQRQFLADGGRQKRLAEVQVKQFLHFELMHQVGHPAEVLQGHPFARADVGRAFARATNAVHVAQHGVFQQHPAIRQVRFGRRGVFGQAPESVQRAQVGIGIFPLASSSRNRCATGPKKISSNVFLRRSPMCPVPS